MKLTIAGSGDAFGSGGRLNTCFLLETAKATLLVDCGASAMPALKKQGIDPNRIEAIVLSHLHGDHLSWREGQLRLQCLKLLVGRWLIRATRLCASFGLYIAEGTGPARTANYREYSRANATHFVP